jgi:ATP-dependent Clp protease ATP-binding subunit ClpC
VYWGKIISTWTLARQKTRNLARKFFVAIATLFVVLGLVALGYVLYQFSLRGIPVWQLHVSTTWQLLLFWTATLVAMYLWYLFERAEERIRYIPTKGYASTFGVIKPLTWGDVSLIPEKNNIDVSRYLSAQALLAIEKAWQLSRSYKQATTMPVHVLISLLTFSETASLILRLGVESVQLRDRISALLRAIPEDSATTTLAVETQKVILYAYFLAWQQRQRKVDLAELFEATLQQSDAIRELFYDLDITADELTNVIAWSRIKRQLRQQWQRFRGKAALRPRGTMNRAMTAIATPLLDALSQDLTTLAQYGYLAPCIGRDKEIEEIFRIMQGGNRRNVLLTGFPGVGRMAIIEGIAQRMVSEDVPDFLRDKRLVSLNVAKLVSGVSPADAQQRLLIALNEIVRSGNIILCIEDIHTMTGISSGGQGSMDVAGTLAQTLSRSSIICLATTTPQDYHRYIESGSSLGEIFEQLPVPEVKGNDAIQILEAKAGAIEYQNKVYFSYDSVAKIVELSNRYLHDRYLPEKAIEILQQVGAAVKAQRGSNAIVTADDVADLLSKKTGIPLTNVTEEESEKLLNLEARIHERMVDQEEAVSLVAASLRRARASLRDSKRPIVNLLFLGPTGVGKTELAKNVARIYFGDEKNMIRLDMSEYQEQTSLSRLLGAGPGYQGSGGGGYLTEAIRKNPFSLVLLDELEKAHPDILNIFLQVIDDGRITDASGRTIDCTNIILIATSNAGTSIIQQMNKEQKSSEEIKQHLLDAELQKYFRIELLNRFDGIVIFKPLEPQHIRLIAGLMLKEVTSNLESRGVSLQVTDAALDELAQKGFDPMFGARPLRRLIQETIQNQLANLILENKLDRRDTVIIDAGGAISVQKADSLS